MSVYCKNCGVSLGAATPKFCPECGTTTAPMHQNAGPVSARPSPPQTVVSGPRRAAPLFLLLGLVLFAVLGNYHVVSGAPALLVKRVNFGFQDTFAAVTDCTTSAWIIASAQHGPLCAALQEAGILESDAAREARVQAEIQQQTDQIMKDAQRQTEELMRQYR